MKKLISFFLVALFLLGSFPATFAEEVEMHEHEGCCEVHADGGIMPLWDCDHSCGSDDTGWVESDRGCYSTWVRKYFKECGKQTSQDVTTVWHHLGPFSYVDVYDPDTGRTVSHTLCETCGRIY